MSKRNYKTKKMPVWKKLVIGTVLVGVGVGVAFAGIAIHKNWDNIKTSVENVFNNKTAETPTKAVEE